MNQSDPVNTPTPIMSLSADASHKRRRGRPRKDSRLNSEEKNMNVKRRSITRNPARYELQKGHHWQQDNRGEGQSDLMLGQVVSGIIEGVFDAGYLLCVRVGNSGTTLRGVVFKPGHYAPISAANDVAPDVQMIRRDEILIQTDDRPASHSPLASQTAHPVLSKGNVVPVILQPSNSMKGAPVSNQSSYVGDSKGKQVLESSIQLNECTPVDPAVDKETLFSQSQIGRLVVDTEGVHFEYDSSNRAQSGSSDLEAKKCTKFPGLPFENLVTEVIKRIHPSQLKESEIRFNHFANRRPEEETDNNAARPLVLEPLRAVQPDPPTKTESFARPLERDRANGMSELLQENSTQRGEQSADTTTTHILGMEVDK